MIRKITEKEYNEAPGVRRSALFNMAKSPAHYKWSVDNPAKETPALAFGRALHCCVLEPAVFESTYAVAPSVSKATKAGREAWAVFEADAAGKEIISEADFYKCLAIRDSIMNHPQARLLLEGPHETSYFWTDELTGLECKIRTDAETDISESHIIVDVKTCLDASTEAFTKAMIKHGYDLQVGMYTEGVEKCTGQKPLFVFIAVEKDPPYAVNVLGVDEYVVLRGKDLFREYLGKVAECEKTGNWYHYNGPDGDVNDLSLPAYLQKQYE